MSLKHGFHIPFSLLPTQSSHPFFQVEDLIFGSTFYCPIYTIRHVENSSRFSWENTSPRECTAIFGPFYVEIHVENFSRHDDPLRLAFPASEPTGDSANRRPGMLIV